MVFFVNWNHLKRELKNPNVTITIYSIIVAISSIIFLVGNSEHDSDFNSVFKYTQMCGMFGILLSIIKLGFLVFQKRKLHIIDTIEANLNAKKFNQKSRDHTHILNSPNEHCDDMETIEINNHLLSIKTFVICLSIIDFLYMLFFIVLQRTIHEIEKVVVNSNNMHSHNIIFYNNLLGSLMAYASFIVCYTPDNIDYDIRTTIYETGENDIVRNFLMNTGI